MRPRLSGRAPAPRRAELVRRVLKQYFLQRKNERVSTSLSGGRPPARPLQYLPNVRGRLPRGPVLEPERPETKMRRKLPGRDSGNERKLPLLDLRGGDRRQEIILAPGKLNLCKFLPRRHTSPRKQTHLPNLLRIRPRETRLEQGLREVRRLRGREPGKALSGPFGQKVRPRVSRRPPRPRPGPRLHDLRGPRRRGRPGALGRREVR